MNDNTTKLLEQLAEKLGTTSRYLWGVLLRQARIDATITSIQFILILLFGLFLWKLHKKLSRKTNSTTSYANTLYGEYEEVAVVPMFFAAIIFIVLLIIAFCSIGDIISGYFNPEYWALKQILDKL